MKWSVIIIIVIVILAIIVLLDIFVPSFRENIGKAIGIELGIIIFVVLVFGLYKLFNNQKDNNNDKYGLLRKGTGTDLLYDPANS